MRLRDQIVEEARAIVLAEMADEPTTEGVIGDVQRLIAATQTAEQAVALGMMFATLERLHDAAFGPPAEPVTDDTDTEPVAEGVGLTE